MAVLVEKSVTSGFEKNAITRNVDTSLYRNVSTSILPGHLEMWFPLNVGRNSHLLLSRLLKIRIPSGTILFWLKNDRMS